MTRDTTKLLQFVEFKSTSTAKGINILDFNPRYVRDINNESLEYMQKQKDRILYIDSVKEDKILE